MKYQVLLNAIPGRRCVGCVDEEAITVFFWYSTQMVATSMFLARLCFSSCLTLGTSLSSGMQYWNNSYLSVVPIKCLHAVMINY